MAKNFFVKFGNGDPRSGSSMSPTFLIFANQAGATLVPPSITELFTGSGFYTFNYQPTLAIAFLVDAGSTLQTSAPTTDRYVSGSIDPVLLTDQQGASILFQASLILGSINTSASLVLNSIGSSMDSFGNTAIDALTVFGKLNRLQEDLEGNAIYNKAIGTLLMLSRGSSTLLIQKQIVDSTAQTTKT